MQPINRFIIDTVQQRCLTPLHSALVLRGFIPDLWKERKLDLSWITSRSWFKLDSFDERLARIFSRAEPVKEAKRELPPPCLTSVTKAFPPPIPWEETLCSDRQVIRKYSLLEKPKREASLSSILPLLSLKSPFACFETMLALIAPVNPQCAEQLREAKRKEEEVIGGKDLKLLAEEQCLALKNMAAGKEMLLFAGTPPLAAELKLPKLSHDPIAVAAQKFLLEDEKAEQLAKMILAKAPPQLSALLKKRGFDLPKELPFWKRLLMKPVEKSVKNLSEGLYKGMKGRLDPYLSPEMQKELYQLFLNNPELEEVLQFFLEKQLDKAKIVGKEFIPQLGEYLPPLVPLLIEEFGYGTLGKTGKFFWLDFARQEDGRLTLTVYGPSQGERSVLRYKNLTEEQLDSAFFLRLFSYRADQTVSYTFEEVEKNLLAPLGPAEPVGENTGANSVQWGLLYEYTKRKGVDLEKTHFFGVRQAFIDLWQHPERDKHLSAIETAAPWLAKKGEELFEKKRISQEEFKSAFATSQDALMTLQDSRKRDFPKGKIFPPGLKEGIKKFFADVGMTTANLIFIKALLVENLGQELEGSIGEILDVVKAELGEIATPPPPPLFTGVTWNIRNAAAKAYEVGMRLFIQPQIYIAQTVDYVAGEFFSRCFPSTARILKQLKYRFLAKALSSVLLTKEQNAKCRELARSLKSMLLHEGKLDFNVPKEEGKPEPIRMKPVRGLLKKSPLAASSSETNLEPFLQTEQQITPMNVRRTLLLWEEQAKGMDPQQRLLFLNRRLMTLPLPNRAEFWSQVQETDLCMEAITKLAFCLQDTDFNCSYEQENQCMVNLFSLYAIAQTLTGYSDKLNLKVVHEKGLLDYLSHGLSLMDSEGCASNEGSLYFADGSSFANWSNQPNFRLADPVAAKRCEALKEFFKPKEGLPLFSEKESQETKIDSMAHPIYKSFLAYPEVLERLKLLGLDENSSEGDKIAALYANRSTDDKPGYHGVLPLPFHLLRTMHRLCNHKLRCFENRQQVQGLAMKSIYDSPYALESKDYKIKDRIRKLTNNSFCREPYAEDSLYRHVSHTYTEVKGRHFNVQNVINGDLEHLLNSKRQKCRKLAPFLLSLDREVKGKRLSQTEIVNQAMELPFFKNLPEQQQRHLRMVFSNEADEPVRVLSLIREDFSLLLKPEYRLMLEFFLLREDLFRQQLEEYPEFFEAVADFFRDAIPFLKKRGEPYGDLLSLFVLAHLEGGKPAGYLLEEFADDPHFPEIAGLAYHLKEPSECSEEERKKIAHDLLRARFLIRKDSFFEEDNEAVFQETWQKWKVCIKEHVDPKTLDTLCRMRGYDPSLSTFAWQGSYPVYTLGEFAIDIEKGVDNGEKEQNIPQIKELLGQFLEEAEIEKCTFSPLENGKILIPELEMEAVLDVAANTLQLFKTWRGERYEWVSKNKEEELKTKSSYWQAGQQMLKLENGQAAKVSRLGDPLEATLPAGLGSLTWFQKREDIQCFVSDNCVRKINFFKLDLTFEVSQVHGESRAESKGDFPGFWIAESQQNPLLASYGRYLLLQNEEGEQKVLLPADALFGAIVNGIGKRFNVGESHLLQALAESYTPLRQKGYFSYSLDRDMRLTSFDPEAMLHLLYYQLASGNMAEADFYLKRLEGIAKREKLPESAQRFILLLHGMAAVSRNQELNLISLRMAALLGENAVLHGEESKISKEQNLINFILTQFNYQVYLENRKLYVRQLSPYQELSILQTLKDQSLKLVEHLNLEKFCRWKGMKETLQFGLSYIEEAAFQPKILQRYQELAARHAPQLALSNPFIRFVKEYFSAPGLPSLTDFTKGGLPIGDARPVEKFILALMKMRKFQSKADAVPFSFAEKIIPFEELPTRFSEVDKAMIAREFLSYYVLAYGEPPEDKKSCFSLKRRSLNAPSAICRGITRTRLSACRCKC